MPKKCYGSVLETGDRKLYLSIATEAGGFVFVSGLISLDESLQPYLDCGIEEQTDRTLGLIRKSLAEAGCKMSDVVKLNVLLKSRDDFDGFNSVVATYFPVDPPARITTVGDFLVDGILVEIDAIAYKGESVDKA